MSAMSVQQKPHPAGLQSVSVCDASVLANSLSDWQQQYLQISPGRFAGSVTEISVGVVQIFREVINQAVDQHGQTLPGKFALGIPIALRGHGYWCGQALDCIDSVFFLRPDAELKFKTPGYSDIYGASVDVAAFRTYSLDDEFDEKNLIAQTREVSALAPEKCAAFRDRFDSFFRAVETNPLILESAPARKQLTFDIMQLLLGMTADLPVSKRSHAEQFIHRHVVDSARDYILSRKSEALTVTDLCEGLRTSHRSLHYAFNKVLGISPVTYLRYIRLNGVRAELVSSARPIRVSEVAAKWGFWHMGMFSVYYKHLFGERPSDTLRNHRTVAMT
ncbi:helix-turn-helix domain-containing protein [Pseudomonas sp. MYb118]|uniref:helix-turn-helix domain-containing protein n=1 Tax=Pseudomonas sp. MYb118 TaxID=1848720 RepID=UPI0034CD2E7E